MLGRLGPGKGDIRLETLIDMNHELAVLSKELDWKWLEEELSPFYADQGRPSVPIRKIAGLLILKQLFNESDESVIARWIENPYWQYFTGETYFQKRKPFDPTDFVLFRKRVGESGVEKILTLSVKVHKGEEKAEMVQMDTTVQEKNITYPTDQKLASKILFWTRRIAKSSEIKLKQTYEKEEKRLRRQITVPSRQKGIAQKRRAALKRLRTIAGRLMREVESKLPGSLQEHYAPYFLFFKDVLKQKRSDKNKCYSIHEPQVSCIAKGKAHKKYEFGCKVSVSRTAKKGVIVAMKCFEGNPYDGDTIAPTLEQLERIVKPLGGERPKKVIYDRGGKGRSKIGDTEILTPSRGSSNLSAKEKKMLRQLFRSRAAIEPTIGHLKSDFGLDRNLLSGTLGDAFNALMAGAAYNFRIRLREIRAIIFYLCKALREAIWSFMTPFWGVSAFDAAGA